MCTINDKKGASAAAVQNRHPGYTLLELLVVVGIITILMSLLLPVLGTVRRHAKITACASNLRQLALAMNTYAIANEGRYPTLATVGTGGNLWDVPPSFYNALLNQGLSHDMFFCPAAQDYSMPDGVFDAYSTFYILNYNIWVPRLNGTNIIPPAPTYTGGLFKIVQPPPATPFAGPARMSDPVAATNPMITDLAGSSGATPPANADATLPGNPYGFAATTNHREGNRLLGVNQAFADGHVEIHSAADMKPYYMGSWWNWR